MRTSFYILTRNLLLMNFLRGLKIASLLRFIENQEVDSSWIIGKCQRITSYNVDRRSLHVGFLKQNMCCLILLFAYDHRCNPHQLVLTKLICPDTRTLHCKSIGIMGVVTIERA